MKAYFNGGRSWRHDRQSDFMIDVWINLLQEEQRKKKYPIE
jgi:hypothetical protein